MTRHRKNAPDKPRPPDRRAYLGLLPPALVIVAGLVAYHNSFSGVFVLDDKNQIVENRRIRNLGSPLSIISHSRRPVVDLTFAMNYAVGRLNVRGYHVVSLAVHVLAALTLFGVVRRTLLSERLGPQFNQASTWLALTTALIWIVHPLTTQGVTYIIQRSESMMGLFYLLTLYCLARGANSSRPQRWSALAVCCCGLGMGSKAVMVTAPVVVLLYDRVFISRSFGQALSRRWGLYLGLAATWAVLAACGIVRGVLFPGDASATVGFGTREITPLEYLATQPGVILHYLRLSLWPGPLCLDYAWPVARSAGAIVPAAVVIVALLGVTVAALKRKPALGFVGAWFFIILSPTSSFIPIKDPIFEHRMYLSLAAVVVLAVVAGHALLRFLARRLSLGDGLRRGVATVLVTVVVIAGTGAKIQRNRVYHSRRAMWSDVLAKYPDNARAQVNLGLALTDAGDAPQALERYRAAAQIDPANFVAHYNLGNAAFRRGDFEEAIPHYQRGVRIKPDYTEALVNWAISLDNLGRAEEAIERFRAALATKSPRARSKAVIEARFNLANALFRTGRLDRAVEEYRRLLKVKPAHIQARYNLAHVLKEQNRIEEAIAELRDILRRRPKHAGARQTLEALAGGPGRADPP